MKKIDLKGQKFNHWTVLEEGYRKGNHQYWLCECDCPKHTKRMVSSTHLRNGNSISCGCVKRPRKLASERIGQKINMLTAINITNQRDSKGSVCLEWQCECGNTIIKSYGEIMSSGTISCGCKENKIQSIKSGMRFGKLTAIEELPERIGKHIAWRCKCDCGNETNVTVSHLISGHTSSCGCLKSKGEFLISSILSNNNIEFQTEYCFSGLRSKEGNGLMRYDFFVDNRYLIEFDGEQHYKERAREGFWKDNYDDLHKRDLEKNQYALENNIPLIRIPY